MPMPTEGAPAPDFTLPDQNGNPVKLADFRGRKAVLYFYPKDDTPGCTIEACGFRDAHANIQATGAVVLGVSPDDAQSHQKFIGKFSLPFTLLSDVDHKIAEAYGAWGEKNMYGRPYMGILRSTFLIDEQGNVQKAWPKVSPQGHDQEVLAAIRGEPAPVKAETPAAAPAPSAPSAEKPAKPAAAKKPAAGAAAKKAAPKAAAPKAAAPKAAAPKAAAPKAAAPKRAAKPAKKAGKKPAAKKAAARKAPAKKAPARKAAKKTAAKKAPARKPARRSAAKKAPAKKPARRSRR